MLHFYCSVSDTDFFFFLFFSSLYLVFFVVNTKPDKRLTHNKHASFLPLECIVSTQSISAVEQGSTDHLKNQTNKQKYFWGEWGVQTGSKVKIGTERRDTKALPPTLCSFILPQFSYSFQKPQLMTGAAVPPPTTVPTSREPSCTHSHYKVGLLHAIQIIHYSAIISHAYFKTHILVVARHLLAYKS